MPLPPNEIAVQQAPFIDLYASYLKGDISHIFYIDHPNVDLYTFANHFFTQTESDVINKLFAEDRIIMQTEDVDDLIGTELPVTDQPPPSFTPHTEVRYTMFEVPGKEGVKVMVTFDRSLLN